MKNKQGWLFLKKDLLILFYVYVRLTCVSLCVLCACLMLTGAIKGHQVPCDWSYTAVTCRCWELNSGSLQEQQVFFTTGPSLL